MVAAFVANLPALREQWRTDRAGSMKTIWMFGVYLLNIGLGIVVVLLLAPKAGGAGGDKALLLTGFILGFIFYGALTFMRVVPRSYVRIASSAAREERFDMVNRLRRMCDAGQGNETNTKGKKHER